MNRIELRTLLNTLPGVDEGSWQYLFQWADDGRATASFVTLIPQPDGTVTATHGDLREKIEPFLGPDGAPVSFSNEDSACEWAWGVIREARQSPPNYSSAQTERARTSAEEQRRRFEEAMRRHGADS